MTVYVVAQLKIHNRARYERYVTEFMPILARFDGKLLAADEKPERVEGAWSGDKVVLLSFPDNEHFRSWVASDDYRRIASERQAATESVVLVLRGFDQSEFMGRSNGGSEFNPR
ncbi:MAG: DUF1330 domain-containing protein [Pararhodobacter sp.]